MEPVSMLATHSCEVLRKKGEVRKEKVNFEGHSAPLDPHNISLATS